jgi:hypothetical protein
MKRLLATYLAALLILAGSAVPAISQTEKTLNTKYTKIHFNDDKDLIDFLWRLGGTRIDLEQDRELASNRVDRIIERVQAILDMRPEGLNIGIYLQRGNLQHNEIAYYQYNTKSVYISVDKVSDGVFAHEISHAIVDQYFTTPAPSKIQEIITQYVDRYLWSDY